MTDIIAPRQRFAPPIVVRQVIRYLSQATGLALIAVCIAVALALVSFAPADPSQNFESLVQMDLHLVHRMYANKL